MMKTTRFMSMLSAHWRTLLTASMPILLLPVALLDQTDRGSCAYMLLLMAVYWTFELLPLPVTSLMPVALAPVMGVMSTNEVAMTYMKSSIMLFVGGNS